MEEGEETKAKLQTVNARLLAQIEEQVRHDEVPQALVVAEKKQRYIGKGPCLCELGASALGLHRKRV